MSTETEAPETEAAPVDAVREAIAKAFADALGDHYIEHHITVGSDLWIRIDAKGWVDAARFAKEKLGFVWLDFVSAIDWMPSPFGRDMDAEQDWGVEKDDDSEPAPQETGYAGGETRFQALLRLASPEEHIGVTIKADIGDENPQVDTLIPVFPGANWHEREMWEMFGIHVVQHPDLRALYLPSGFEGNPMRKDFPLVARRVKPWPGIVDVEAMPEVEEPAEAPAAEQGEASTATAEQDEAKDSDA